MLAGVSKILSLLCFQCRRYHTQVHMQLLGLKSFKAAGVMLFGLLAYDVFWVFGSPKIIGDNVMLAVATSDALTGPTRLLFPRFSGSIGEASRFPFSLLGKPT